MDVSLQDLFKAIKAGDAEAVRKILLQDKGLVSCRQKDPAIQFEHDVEEEAYKFLGAYIGSLTPLQLAIFVGNDAIAKDILDRMMKDDLDIPLGGGNTALHLATFLGAREIVKALLERGANAAQRNAKGFAPVDVVDDPDMRQLYQH